MGAGDFPCADIPNDGSRPTDLAPLTMGDLVIAEPDRYNEARPEPIIGAFKNSRDRTEGK